MAFFSFIMIAGPDEAVNNTVFLLFLFVVFTRLWLAAFLAFFFFSGHCSIPILKKSFSSSWGRSFATDEPEFSTRKFSHGGFRVSLSN
jgi:hypothetical protein